MLILFVKSIVFTIIVPGIVAVLFPLLISGEAVPENILIVTLGIILLVSGLSVYSWCVWDFITFGKGTPAPIDAPKYLVVRGLYHYSRNPMYVGVLLVIVGWALLYSCLPILIYGVFVVIILQMFILYYEEPKLLNIFGSDYEEYKVKVNRWLPWFF
ncbi:MAG: isoprenylcysteine carboxylmethyltransferase family protein [Methylococcales bacterium]|nr:isoprenylcysteine carboxylmethyltransferase family protein [Methylococcales bacterium]